MPQSDGLRFPRLVIAALGGGLGKTTLALGLAGVWRSHGVPVAPFKKGPDYIDAAWLGRICGAPCRNLDTYMIPAEALMRQFAAQGAAGRVALIEGNRGLYDGMDAQGTFSTAELAKTLKASVVLVVNCAKVTRTAAAMVLGAKAFDPQVQLAAVVLNNIAGERHERVVRQAIEEHCGVPVVGAIARLKRPVFTDRHLGVVPPAEDPALEESLSWAKTAVRDSVDWRRLLEIAQAAPPIPNAPPPQPATAGALQPHGAAAVRIGILQDAAFQFYYPENLEALESLGARIVPCSAIHDQELPQLDALYIGGGFPETCAAALSANASFRASVHEAAEAGLPIYAECGGLMFLGHSLELPEGSAPMAGLFPLRFAMEERPVAHGYTALSVEGENPFYPQGLELRGHEFHHSRLLEFALPQEARLILRANRGQGLHGGMDGMLYKNTLALYTHVHALGTPQWARGLVAMARRKAGG